MHCFMGFCLTLLARWILLQQLTEQLSVNIPIPFVLQSLVSASLQSKADFQVKIRTFKKNLFKLEYTCR